MALALTGDTDGNSFAGSSSQTPQSEGSTTSMLSSSSSTASSSTEKKTSTAAPAVATASSAEMIGGCCVCPDEQGYPENPLVYCDGCEVAVHQACYGITTVPAGSWFCRRCEADDQSKIKCELCPSKDGALKRTETGQWAHVVCALYIPEVRFGNNNTMEPILIRHINADRYTKSCYLCETKSDVPTSPCGAVMNCKTTGCKQSFHVTCAQAAGLLCEEAGQGLDNVVYCGYCEHHFRKSKANNFSANNKNSVGDSGSSYLDSASDSSQDNDLRCNSAEQSDKNSTGLTNKSKNNTADLRPRSSTPTASTSTQPTSLSLTGVNQTTSSSPQATSREKMAPTSQSPSSANTSSASGGSINNKTISSANASSASQKKKRGPKGLENLNESPVNSPATTPAPTTAINTQQPLTTTPHRSSDSAAQDVYNWPGTSSKDSSSAVNHTNSNNKGSKKKPPTSTQSGGPNSKPTPSTSASARNPASSSSPKVSNPNLSISPSLASPSSTSAKSSISLTGSSMTATALSSSFSATSSKSPSPVPLSSPNTSHSSRATGTIRTESPLAAPNSKICNGPSGGTVATQESKSANNVVALTDPQQRVDTDDPKRNNVSFSSTTTSNIAQNVPQQPALSAANPAETDTLALNPSRPNTLSHPIQSSVAEFQQPTPNAIGANPALNLTTGSVPGPSPSSTQPAALAPTVASPTPAVSTISKSKAKSSQRAPPKKKTPGTQDDTPQKAELKTKPSRKRKAAAAIASSSGGESAPPKAEPKKTSKSKSAAKASEYPVPEPSRTDAAARKTNPQSLPPPTTASKRRARGSSNENSVAPSPAKKARNRKKIEPVPASSTATTNSPGSVPSSAPSLANAPGLPLMVSTPMISNRILPGASSVESQDFSNRYFSPMISPYAGLEQVNNPALSRSSLSRLFHSSSADPSLIGTTDDPAKAFDELRESTWSNLSKYILDQAQQFDIPSLIGTLYTLRSENEKLVSRVRDLTMKRDQLAAINARLDMQGPTLTQHLNNTSPNFSAVVSGLTNSPKGLATPSPSSAPISKPPPLAPMGPFPNHVPTGSLGSHGYLDRSSPLITQTHSNMSNIKTSSISTPSPPIGALMAHSNNRAGLITVNSPYMSNMFPQMNSLAQLGNNPQASYYQRQ